MLFKYANEALLAPICRDFQNINLNIDKAIFKLNV